jgi:hypothetical protein
MLSANKRNTSLNAYHILESQEIIPTDLVRPMSTLYTQGLFYLVVVQLEELDLVWRILLVGTDGSMYHSARCYFIFIV